MKGKGVKRKEKLWLEVFKEVLIPIQRLKAHSSEKRFDLKKKKHVGVMRWNQIRKLPDIHKRPPACPATSQK